MLNKVMLIGRLGRDPELRYTQSGTPVTTLNIATDESYVDRDGNKIDRTEWHRVSVFQRQAENCHNFLSKGSLVYVEGSLTTRKWQDAQGQDRTSTEIKAQRVQFLEKRGANQGANVGAPYGGDNDGYRRQAQQPRDDMGGYASERSYAPRPQQSRSAPQQDLAPSRESDNGPLFPSEAATMDEVPF